MYNIWNVSFWAKSPPTVLETEINCFFSKLLHILLYELQSYCGRKKIKIHVASYLICAVYFRLTEEVGSCDMVLDSVLSSPHRRSPSIRKSFPNELGSWSTLVQRHRFLLTALALLTFLCTIYLYFAVTLGSSSSCFGLTGTQKAQCQLELAKTSMAKGKLKILWYSGLCSKACVFCL